MAEETRRADIIGVLTASDRASTGGALESRAPRSPTVIPLVARRTAAPFPSLRDMSYKCRSLSRTLLKTARNMSCVSTPVLVL